MDTFKSIKVEAEKEMARLYQLMVKGREREGNQSSGLSLKEFLPQQAGCAIETPGTSARHETQQPKQDEGLLKLLKWKEAIQKFKIGKIYHDVSWENVQMKYPQIAADIDAWWVPGAKTPLYLTGCTGSGKTYTLIAMLRRLVERNYNWLIYKRSDEMDNFLLKACQDGQEEHHLESFREVPVLFIDDLGVERPTERVIKQYYNIIESRISNEKPIIFSSNICIDDINKTLGDRIASRLQLSTQIIFPKKDLRKDNP